MAFPFIWEREPPELKHLSKGRKRKQRDSVSKGDRKRNRANRIRLGNEVGDVVFGRCRALSDSRSLLERSVIQGDSPVDKSDKVQYDVQSTWGWISSGNMGGINS